MDYIEVTAKTVSEAITKACIDLNLPSDRLDIKVVSEGSKGFLGIGSKPAVIRVANKAGEEPASEVTEKDKKEASSNKIKQEKKEIKSEAKTKPKEGQNPKKNKKNRKNISPDKTSTEKKVQEDKEEFPEKTEKNQEKRLKEIVPVYKTEEEIEEMKSVAGKFLTDVFSAMNVNVDLNFEYVPEMACLDIELKGEDMGVIIGHRGQTLDSLQYLTSLVLNKKRSEYIRIKIDTENYRKRRKETLENLAKNIAYKVKKTKKPVVLEAMNPFERRIIHSTLQPNKYVDTYSEGKEPYRHVVIVPKKQ